MMLWGHRIRALSWIFLILATVTFLELIAAGFWWAAAGPDNAGRTETAAEPPAREILDQRSVTGDVTPADYGQVGASLGWSGAADEHASQGALAARER